MHEVGMFGNFTSLWWAISRGPCLSSVLLCY